MQIEPGKGYSLIVNVKNNIMSCASATTVDIEASSSQLET
jgi:hypothetical protein